MFELVYEPKSPNLFSFPMARANRALNLRNREEHTKAVAGDDWWSSKCEWTPMPCECDNAAKSISFGLS